VEYNPLRCPKLQIRRLTDSISIILIIFYILLTAGCGGPQGPAESEVSFTEIQEPVASKALTETPDVPEGKVFLWEITSGAGTVYLLGSIHVAGSDIYPLNKAIEDAFQAANNLVVEIDISKVNPLATAELMMKYGIYPEGETLRSSVSEELYMKLDEYFIEYGVDISTMDMFRPWVIDMLMEELRLEAMGYHAQNGIDMYFIEKATENNLNIIELETAELQLELLSSFSDEIMILAIEDAFQDPPTKEIMEELFNGWENGDTGIIESLIFEGLYEDPVFESCYRAIYIDRNYGMADKIEVFMSDEETYFIVVGAAHLVGEEGLIKILENRGYGVKQLPR
jgi:uncharacterized protein YbaP (TraB family)